MDARTLVTASQEDAWEIIVAWNPGQSTPITIYGIDVNGQTLVRGDVEIHSPYIQLLGAPQKDAQGRYYNVSWAIAPEVDLDKIVIAIAPRRAPDDFKVIDENDNAPRGCLWRKLNQRVPL